MIKEVSDTLSQISWARLSKEAKEKLLLCVLANCSVAVAGLPFVKLPRPAAGGGTHMLYGGGHTASAREAAFYNGAVMHSRTQDDFHPIGNLHVSTVLLPAAFAAAEASKASGVALLDALAAGYSATAGMSRKFSERTTPKGLRSTSLYSPFASTTAAARLAGFDSAKLGNALALVASLNGGLTQCWRDGSDEWQLHAAAAAANGLLAADLTKAGVRGGSHALDGPSGFYNAHAGYIPTFAEIAPDFDPEGAVLDTVLKRYPASGIGQPVVLLAERIAAEHGPRLKDIGKIEKIVLWMNPFEMHYPGNLNKGPFTSFSDVLMSASFLCASVLANGRFLFSDLFDYGRADRNRLIDAIEVKENPALGTLSCRMDIRLTGGETITSELINGGAELALDWTTVDEWAVGLWKEGGRNESQYQTFRKAVRDLEKGSAASLIATLAT